ncbi:bacteriocin immunity protein [Clostridium pasteurianum]|uniref:bacteriocin immunity protein n=1 Tax=Clostridium pasteurianum TaxID=1501 RepID=UPI0022609C50|nr:bacteriocin immunity protein [Clostridium pasteurianum]UZW14491.1 bacteriocin immunity protein [Clostridium pasteurianum]
MKNNQKNLEAIKNTLKNLDSNQHKPLINLLNEYKDKLVTEDNCIPLLNSLEGKISMCILKNNLKVPNEVSKLIRTLNSLKTKYNVNFGIL